jgi:hypothetical protein
MSALRGLRARVVLAVVLAAAAGRQEVLGATQVPPWVQGARTAQFPNLPNNAGAIIALDEQELEVRPDGKLVSTHRWAARILTRDGRDAATLFVPYTAKTEKVDSAKAWLIRPSGEVRVFGKGEILDVASFGERELYSEARKVLVSAEDEALPGSVFGAAVTVSGRTVTAQDMWLFQSQFPVVLSRYTVRLPPGWRVEGRVFHHPGIQPVVAGNATTWSLQNQPALEHEPLGPSLEALNPTLAITIFLPAGEFRVESPPQAFCDLG